MKKIFYALLIAVIAVSMFLMGGCGNDAFAGNYQEVTDDTQKQEVLAKIGSDVIADEVTNGAKLTFGFNSTTTVNGQKSKVNLSGNVKYKGEEASASVKFDGTSMTAFNLKLYLKLNVAETNGDLYVHGTSKDLPQDLKVKISATLEELKQFIGNIGGEGNTPFAETTPDDNVPSDISGMIEMLNGAKLFVEETETQTKIKIDFTDLLKAEMGEEANVKSSVAYVILNENGAMTNFKMDLNYVTTQNLDMSGVGGNFSMDMSVKANFELSLSDVTVDVMTDLEGFTPMSLEDIMGGGSGF